jgi:E3 ubiquitin-protein ligase RNF14
MNDEPDDDQRAEELIALEAIYPEIRRTVRYGFELLIPVTPATSKVSLIFGYDTTNSSIYEVGHLPPLKLRVELPKGYPGEESPNLVLECCWLTASELRKLTCAVDLIWKEAGGSLMIFNVIEYLNEKSADAFGHKTVVIGSTDLGRKEEFLRFDEEATLRDFSGQTFHCEICQYAKKGTVCTQLVNCGHVFCTQCLIAYYSACIEQGYIPQVVCPDLGCGVRTVDEKQLGKLVGGELVKRYRDLSRKLALEADPMHYMACPRDLCQALMKKNPDDLLAICPECSFAFCSVCKRSWHGYYEYCRMQEPPVEVVEQYANTDDEDTKRLIESQWGKRNMVKYVKEYHDEKAFREYMESNNNRHCPTCATPIEKSMGCNKMTCGICHTFFCFLCAEVLDRDNPYRHYGDSRSRCYQKLFEGMTIEEPDVLDFGFLN